jgi:plastocyanin
MAQTEKDLLTRLADRGEQVVGRITDLPGAKSLIDRTGALTKQVNDIQRRLRSLDPLEKRVTALEKRLEKIEGKGSSAKRPAARKPAAKGAPMQASIAQKDEQFSPHVVAITSGSTVAFPNADPFFHNVFSLSRGASFNLGRYPSGASRSKVFSRPGIVKVFCEIHSHMSAVIRVFDNDFFTIPADDGTFVIKDVPAGEHTVVAWHERIGERRDRVTIRAGASTQITFTLPVLESGQ